MLSRREWIARVMVLGGFGVAGFAKHGVAQATGKISKEAAKYQNHPNNMQMCGMCKFYIPPGGKAGSGMMGGMGMMRQRRMGGQMGQGMMSQGMMAAGTCQLVQGQITPMGWCVLYQPVSR